MEKPDLHALKSKAKNNLMAVEEDINLVNKTSLSNMEGVANLSREMDEAISGWNIYKAEGKITAEGKKGFSDQIKEIQSRIDEEITLEEKYIKKIKEELIRRSGRTASEPAQIKVEPENPTIKADPAEPARVEIIDPNQDAEALKIKAEAEPNNARVEALVLLKNETEVTENIEIATENKLIEGEEFWKNLEETESKDKYFDSLIDETGFDTTNSSLVEMIKEQLEKASDKYFDYTRNLRKMIHGIIGKESENSATKEELKKQKEELETTLNDIVHEEKHRIGLFENIPEVKTITELYKKAEARGTEGIYRDLHKQLLSDPINYFKQKTELKKSDGAYFYDEEKRKNFDKIINEIESKYE